MEGGKEAMTRTFTIKETPNKQGFDRYFIVADNGKPYEEAKQIPTNSKTVLVEELIKWIKEKTNA